MTGLRLRDWRRETLEAGLVVLFTVIIGSIILYGLAMTNPAVLQAQAEGCTPLTAEEFNETIARGDPVAVMFSSDTCPVCRQMEPHWRKLCESEGPVKYALVKYSRDTHPLYIKYGVLETPTFILFVNATPKLIHVGGFPGPDVEENMRRWAEAGLQGDTGYLEALQWACASCHSLPEGLDSESLQRWVQEDPDEILAKRVALAAHMGTTVSGLYGGITNLTMVIMGMPGLPENFTVEDAEKTAQALDIMSVMLQQGETGERIPEDQSKETGEEQALGAALGIAGSLVAGLVVAFSPCVFPLLVSYVAALAQGGQARTGATAAKAFAAASAGILVIGVLFLAAGDAVSRASGILLPVAAATILAAGVLGYLDVPTFVNVGLKSRRGIIGFSFIYGLLAVQCSFPLVAGTLLLVASGGLGIGLVALAAFTLGVATPVALAVYASGRPGFQSRLVALASKRGLRVMNLVLAVAGGGLLFYSLGLV